MSQRGRGVAPEPFHVSAAEHPAPARRLLLVSAHFPPSSAVGALRWEKMAHVAVERGWGVDVLCADPADAVSPDSSRLADLPPHVRVFTLPRYRPAAGDGAVEQLLRAAWAWRRQAAPGGAVQTAAAPASSAPRAAGSTEQGVPREQALAPWQGVLGLRRAYFSSRWQRSVEDAAASAAALGLRVADGSHRLVVTSGPPHFAHLAGASLSRSLGIPFVMDMRDPWSLGERFAVDLGSTVFARDSIRNERRAVAGASLVVCNTELASQALRGAHPDAASRVITVMNGADDEPLPAPTERGAFVLAYAGAIYFDRDPAPLFRAIRRVVDDLGLSPSELRAEFMGPIDPSPDALHALALELGLTDYVRHHAARPRREALQFLANATMLVSLPQDTETAIPSKVFEYSRFDAWLLALARPGSATALVLDGSAADVVAPDDAERLASVIRRRVEEHRAGMRPVAVGGDGRFSRRRQATILFDRIESLVG